MEEVLPPKDETIIIMNCTSIKTACLRFKDWQGKRTEEITTKEIYERRGMKIG